MSDAVKVGFVPFSSTATGILVAFCDDALEARTGDHEGAGEVRRGTRKAGSRGRPVQGQERGGAGHPGAAGIEGGLA